MTKTNSNKLKLWQERLEKNQAACQSEREKMLRREALYKGEADRIKPLVPEDLNRDGSFKRARHIRNIISENIESQVNTAVPQPKVTARRPEDEQKARLIEDMLRNELDRLPFETINDMLERTVPIQGGGYLLAEWDSSECSHLGMGEVTVSALHPLQVIPQAGVFSDIEDMDYIILRLGVSAKALKKKYKLTDEEIKMTFSDSDEHDSEELITQYTAYYKNDSGGIGRYSWAGQVQLEDMEDYQARRQPVCTKCGAAAQSVLADECCPFCGGTLKYETLESEEIYIPIVTPMGKLIPGAGEGIDENGKRVLVPNRIPLYKPDIYPLVLQKNISLYGSLLGDSDVDKISDQQNTINRLEMKVIDRLIKAGTRITLPDRADLRVDPEDSDRWYIGSAADRSCIGVYDFKGDLQYEMGYLAQVYEEARQMLGITDSFQGRRDASASSAVAKQFAAAQAAGRLESKRIMKDAAYAKLFELIFKLKLAYTDEVRSVCCCDANGSIRYESFSRYDFLEQDAAGNYYWNDRFLFSCDASAPLANNRERMWENTTAHFSSGAFGDPTKLETLILYWTKMELLHYPGAADTKAWLQKRQQSQEVQVK
ncbi:MAG: hypothetical protein IKM51_00525 [Oscillospiraceae bacterium]|nr:hypothetical protein [Oscillospiraceae bacterium]